MSELQIEKVKNVKENVCEQNLQNKKVIEKLLKIQCAISSANKDGFNAFHKFKYVSINSLLEQFKPIFDEHKILLNMRTVSSNVSDREVEEGGKIKRNFVMENEYECIFIDVESGETYVAEKKFKCIGIDQGEKGLGKAISYAKKYFLLNFFNIPAYDEEVDARENNVAPPAKGFEQKPAKGFEQKPSNKPSIMQKEYPFEVKGNPDAPITRSQASFWFSIAAKCGIQIGNGSISRYTKAVRGFDYGDDIMKFTNANIQGDAMIFTKGEMFVAKLVAILEEMKSHGYSNEGILQAFDNVKFIEQITPVILEHGVQAFEKYLENVGGEVPV